MLRNSVFKKTHQTDPVAFVHDCIDWHGDDGPTFYQDECLGKLAECRRIAVRGPHGVGKTAPAVWAVLWFASTREEDVDSVGILAVVVGMALFVCVQLVKLARGRRRGSGP